jgi:energy-coupling factor transporter ATP-binding protein EcfA2
MFDMGSSVTLSADDLVLAYERTEVVHGVSVRLQPGVVTALVGPNGSGKSTLLRSLARLHRIGSGRVSLTKARPRPAPPTTPDQTVPDQTVPDQTVPDQTVPDQTVPDQTVPDQTVPDQTVPDQTLSGGRTSPRCPPASSRRRSPCCPSRAHTRPGRPFVTWWPSVGIRTAAASPRWPTPTGRRSTGRWA